MHTIPHQSLTAVAPGVRRLVVPAQETLSGAAAPSLARHAPIGNDLPFSIVVPSSWAPTGYSFAVRWTEDGVHASRFLLSPVTGVYFPTYDNEVIPVNSWMEIWLETDALVDIPQTTFDTSLKLTLDYCRPCLPSTPDDLTLVFGAIPVLPENTECNPFCFPLC